jgi:hypothetical protein
MKNLLTWLLGLFAMTSAFAVEESRLTPALSEKSIIVVHRAVPAPVETISLDDWVLEAKFAEAPEAHATEELSAFGPAKLATLSLADGQTIYALSRLSLPSAIQADQVDAMFESTKENLLRKGRGSLKLEENVTVVGLPGRRYVMEYTREHRIDDYRTDCRLVLIDGAIYILQFRQPLNFYSAADGRSFFNAVKRKTPDPSHRVPR